MHGVLYSQCYIRTSFSVEVMSVRVANVDSLVWRSVDNIVGSAVE
jgi:hypothetical protein